MGTPQRLDALLVELVLDTHAHSPEKIMLVVDPTYDPLHSQQAGSFSHRDYDCCCRRT